MAENNIDKIFLDGESISSCKFDSLDTITRFEYEKIRLSSLEFNEKGKIDRLISYWKEIKKYEKIYPNSEYIKKIKETILNNAKFDLPEDIYNLIYANSS